MKIPYSVTDVRRLLVASVLWLGIRLFLGPTELVRNLPLAVSGRCEPGRLPGVLFRLFGRGSKAPVDGSVQPGPVSRYRLPGTAILCMIRRRI